MSDWEDEDNSDWVASTGVEPVVTELVAGEAGGTDALARDHQLKEGLAKSARGK